MKNCAINNNRSTVLFWFNRRFVEVRERLFVVPNRFHTEHTSGCRIVCEAQCELLQPALSNWAACTNILVLTDLEGYSDCSTVTALRRPALSELQIEYQNVPVEQGCLSESFGIFRNSSSSKSIDPVSMSHFAIAGSGYPLDSGSCGRLSLGWLSGPNCQYTPSIWVQLVTLTVLVTLLIAYTPRTLDILLKSSLFSARDLRWETLSSAGHFQAERFNFDFAQQNLFKRIPSDSLADHKSHFC